LNERIRDNFHRGSVSPCKYNINLESPMGVKLINQSGINDISSFAEPKELETPIE
jgi:hypothetical protein